MNTSYEHKLCIKACRIGRCLRVSSHVIHNQLHYLLAEVTRTEEDCRIEKTWLMDVVASIN